MPGVKIQVFHGYAAEKKDHWVIRRYFDTYFTQGPYFTSHFEALAKKYGDFVAINNVSFKIEKGESLGIIDEKVFYFCTSLQSIVIPNSVTAIMSYAFGGCRSLKSVTIGSGVTSINKN